MTTFSNITRNLESRDKWKYISLTHESPSTIFLYYQLPYRYFRDFIHYCALHFVNVSKIIDLLIILLWYDVYIFLRV